MHYSCVIAKNELLVTPLCDKLSSEIQLSIRTFLERVDVMVTNPQLNDIIVLPYKNNVMDDSLARWKPAGDSIYVNSPLQDFLKTPISKPCREERDRELKKLRSELELERYEKSDLQEELKECNEQIKKLGM